MPGQFTFLDNEWDNVISQEDILLPGIEKISTIYWSSRSRELKALSCDRRGDIIDDHAEVLNTPEGRYRLQKARDVSKPYTWIKIEESPLMLKGESQNPLDLFSELQNTILILRYRNEADDKYDVLILYLSKNLNQFGVAISEKVLSTENKSIISSILYHYFKKIVSDIRHNNSILQRVRKNLQATTREARHLKDEIGQLTLKMEEMILSLANQQLQSISKEYHKEFRFSSEALERLKSYRGNIKHLPEIIEQAVIFTGNIFYESFDGVVSLDANALLFDDYQADREEPEALKRIDSRESRAIQLLDRLEKSALILKSKDISLTGANIGRNLPQPISAPAITDALKKYKTTIINLMRKYPGKWELIREEFRPIQNLFKQGGEEKGEIA